MSKIATHQQKALSIRTKLAIVLTFVLATSFMMGALMIKNTLLSRFSELEDNDAKADLSRLAEVLSD